MLSTLPEKGTLLAGDKMSYRLGPPIAEGGEGRVFEIEGRTDIVGKIYKEGDFTRAEKLKLMIERSNRRLRNIAAWPLSSLVESDGSTVGFVMESLTGWQPLHNVYQIRSRLKLFPHRNYQFLVRVARNLATCVHHVHEADLVIGDLNESNVLVSSGAMVKLIDVDSFQVATTGELFPCKVGKPELLPPELQGHSLEGIVRTPNHDLFSLAVLVFETLVYGRHPFAGTPLTEEEISLERCIALGYYTYTSKREIGLKPARNFKIDWLPIEIRELFERAFDPLARERPSAKEWYFALKDLENNLRGCRDNPSHTFYNKLPNCPWCALEDFMNLALFRPALIGPEESVEVSALLQKIDLEKSTFPIGPPVVEFKLDDLTPAPMSTKVRLLSRFARSGMFPFWGFFLLMNAMRTSRSVALIVFGFLCLIFFVATVPAEYIAGRVKKAQRELEKLRERWNNEASPKLYDKRIAYYQSLGSELQNVKRTYEHQREGYVHELHQEELTQFLKKFSILIADTVSLSGDRLSYLHDHGIATAAEVQSENLKMLPRILAASEKIELMNWRENLEAQFWKGRQYRLSVHQERQLILKVRKENERKKAELEGAEEDLAALRLNLKGRQREIEAAAEKRVAVLRHYGPIALALEGKKSERDIWSGNRF